MGILDMVTYTQLDDAAAMRDAAQIPSGGVGFSAGYGAGMGYRTLVQQSTSGLMQQATSGAMQQPKGGDGGAKTGGIPDVMTPSEAASILKVSEEDVVAAIEDGSLKAKKLGKAYRISKEALEAFLNS